MSNYLTSTRTQIRFLFLSALMVAAAFTANPALSDERGDQGERAKALALEQRGMNAEAEEIWAGISKTDPKNAEALAHIGLLEARQQHLESAISYYRRSSEINPELPGLQMNLGLALFKAAQFPDAVATLSSEIRKHPGDLRLTVLLGMAHYGMKDYLVAIPYLQRAAESDRQNVTLRIALARSCMLSKQYRCVLDVHKEIVSLHSETAAADMLAGEALDALGDVSGATDKFRAAILANPKEPNAHFGLGYLFWAQGQWKEAASEFQEEIQVNPHHLIAPVYLADAWVQQEDFDRALPLLNDLMSLQLSEWLPHKDLGMVHAHSGRAADAIREFKVALQFNPADAETRRQLVLLYKSIGSKDQVEREFGKSTPETAGHLPLAELIGPSEVPEP